VIPGRRRLRLASVTPGRRPSAQSVKARASASPTPKRLASRSGHGGRLRPARAVLVGWCSARPGPGAVRGGGARRVVGWVGGSGVGSGCGGEEGQGGCQSQRQAGACGTPEEDG